MVEFTSFDWDGYIRGLEGSEALELGRWLLDEGLGVGEFIEIVDRAYAAAPERWRRRPRRFMAHVGRPAAMAYARRKRWYAGLIAAYEDALASGALPGDVAPLELQR